MEKELLPICEQLVEACKRAYNRGIQMNSGGNVSARVPGKDLMIVKASGSSFIDSTVEGFVITDFDGNKVSGEGKPTREALLHGLIYRLCPNVQAVVHTHAPYSIAWSSSKKDFSISILLLMLYSKGVPNSSCFTVSVKVPSVPLQKMT